MTNHSSSIFIIAGEPSGDFLGGKLMQALCKEVPSHSISGIGGQHMITQGLHSLFPMEELSVMGLSEIIPHALKIKRRIKETVEWITKHQPQVLVTIDSPGFCLRVIKSLKMKGVAIPVVHYVAPSVWAWRRKRAKKLAGLVDHLLTLFSFEPPYFEKEGLSTTFVGHPAIELQLDNLSPMSFRLEKKLSKNIPLLCLLPGSRRGEISKLLPTFLEVAQALKGNHPSLEIVIPTLPHLLNEIDRLHQQHAPNLRLHMVTETQEKYQAMRSSTVALAASGTVSLELALCKLPMVIAYKVSPITAWIVKRLVSIKHVSLVNILLKESLVKEHLQEECTPNRIITSIEELLTQEFMREKQLEGFKSVQSLLQCPPLLPSERAAKAILNYIKGE